MRLRQLGIQLESLKVFCDVARCRSFSQAALANGLTQSAASQIVLHLEKRLGVQLINRSTRPLQLTGLGQAYYDGCKKLVEQYMELEASIRDAQAQIATSVQVAAIYSVGLGDMGHYVERFTAAQPNVKVHVEYLHPDRVHERVLDGTADFGLVSFPRKSRELVSLPWREEDMVLTCSPGHALAAAEAIRPEQLRGEKYVGFDKDLVIRRQVDRFLRDHDVAVDLALEFDTIENIKQAVEIAAGVALLPEPTVRREVLAGTLVARPLVGWKLVRPLGIIYRRHHKLSTTAQRFIELLRQPEGSNGCPPPDVNGFPNGNGAAARRNGFGHGPAGGSKRTG
jgi:DNA-binding transcriptional LysR family regulator